MARSNIDNTRVKPATSQLLTLTVVRRQRVSPHFVRVTLGGGDVETFRYLGFDQWFRLFIPVGERSDVLARLPQKLDTLSYLKYLTISRNSRPVLRNYTVRDFRQSGQDGPEIDVDFVVHGSVADDTAGPAASWAQRCAAGDAVAILDEGISFTPHAGQHEFLLVSDETGLPAIAGILASLPGDATGTAVVEIPGDDDRQELARPSAVELVWVPRNNPQQTPGVAALAVAKGTPVPAAVYAWAVGESTLPTSLRRHWLEQGVSKRDIVFCGYWRAGS